VYKTKCLVFVAAPALVIGGMRMTAGPRERHQHNEPVTEPERKANPEEEAKQPQGKQLAN